MPGCWMCWWMEIIHNISHSPVVHGVRWFMRCNMNVIYSPDGWCLGLLLIRELAEWNTRLE